MAIIMLKQLSEVWNERITPAGLGKDWSSSLTGHGSAKTSVNWINNSTTTMNFANQPQDSLGLSSITVRINEQGLER
ncbi:hypothetical protein NL676_028382, partial [Syzygium grande]